MMPVVIPVTTPEASTVAMLISPLVHVPPSIVLVSVVVPPVQSVKVPEIAGGMGFTLMFAVLTAKSGVTHPAAFCTEVIVKVVVPELNNIVVKKLPEVGPIVNMDVRPVAVLGALRLYVTMYVPAPRLLQLIVIVELVLAQTSVADGGRRVVRSGLGVTDIVVAAEIAVGDVMH